MTITNNPSDLTSNERTALLAGVMYTFFPSVAILISANLDDPDIFWECKNLLEAKLFLDELKIYELKKDD